MTHPNRPQDAGTSESSANTDPLLESTTQPGKIQNRMKFVLDNGLRKSLENYYKTSE